MRLEEGYQKCPEFWDSTYNQKYARLWQTGRPETDEERAILDNHIGMFALCIEGVGGFEYAIVGLYEGGKVPEGMNLFGLPESGYAVFSVKGPLPASLQQLNAQIWQQWYPCEGPQYEANKSIGKPLKSRFVT